MKNMKWMRFIALSLLFFMIPLLVSTKAQNPSAAVNLEGTQWEGPSYSLVTLNGPQITQFIYRFDKAGKVSWHLRTLQSQPSSYEYSGITGKHELTLNVAPIASVAFLEVGTYQLKGKSIHLEFSDHSISAVVDSGSMKGEITYKKSDKKEVWFVKKAPEANNSFSSSSTGGTSPSPHVIRNADGTLRPASGYQWINPEDKNDLRVKLMQGLIEPEAGKLLPASGYQWVNPKDPNDFRVEPIP